MIKDNKRWKELMLELTTLEQPDKEWLGKNLGNLQKEQIFLLGKRLENSLSNVKDYLHNYLYENKNNKYILEFIELKEVKGSLKWENEQEAINKLKEFKELRDKYVLEHLDTPTNIFGKLDKEEEKTAKQIFDKLGIQTYRKEPTFRIEILSETQLKKKREELENQKYETKILQKLEKKEQANKDKGLEPIF